MKPISVVNKFTGEIMEFPVEDEKQMADSYRQIHEMATALDRAKKKIRGMVLTKLDDAVDDSGIPAGQYIWKKQVRRYQNYDLGVLREVVTDQDLFNQLIKPDKTAIETMAKESVLGESLLSREQLSALHESLQDERTPSVAVVLEKVKP